MRKGDAARVWLAYQGLTWLAFQTAATATSVFLIVRVGVDPLQLVLVGTVMEITVTLAEVPTGVVADTVSRRLSVIVGVVLMGGGLLLYSVPSYPVVLVGGVVWGLGYTFTSGADVAWITDEVGEAAARPLYVRGAQLRQLGILGGIGLGALLGLVGLWIPIALGGVGQFAIAAWLAVRMPETGFVRPPPGERRSARTTFDDAAGLVRRSPTLLVVIGVMLLLGLSSEGIDRLWTLHVLDETGVPSSGDAIVWTALIEALGLVTAVAATEMVRRRADLHSDQGVERTAELVIVAMIAGVVAVALTTSYWAAVAAMCLVAASWEVSEPVLQSWVNRGLDPRTRATVNSMASQAHAVGEVAGGPLWGTIARTRSTPAALIGAGLVQVPSLVLLRRRRRGRLRVSPGDPPAGPAPARAQPAAPPSRTPSAHPPR